MARIRTATLDIDALREGHTPSRLQRAIIVMMLALPAVLAELSNTLMQYIDAGMVGHIGAHATASIGIVESSIWLLDGLLGCAAAGFTVQVAQLIGAGKDRDARRVMRQSIVVMALFSFGLMLFGAAISAHLPRWFGADETLHASASTYFLICCVALIPVGMVRLATGMFQCAGDMKTPSVLNIAACVLDVCLNAFLINDQFVLPLLGASLVIPGFGLGIYGAALGTLSAQSIVAVVMMWILLRKSSALRIRESDSWAPQRSVLGRAGIVSGPMFLERFVISAGYIAITAVVTPLGTIAVAANSLAVTAEAVAYMPGFGISVAATTLVGQAIGANRKDLAKSFARLSVALGMAIMACMGAVLFFASPLIMSMLTPVPKVIELGVRVLQIEAFAEPLFGAAIVSAGALRGAGDTLVPTLFQIATIWGLRLTASAALAPVWGLVGVWSAMAAELCVRGLLFLVRLLRGRWLERTALIEAFG